MPATSGVDRDGAVRSAPPRGDMALFPAAPETAHPVGGHCRSAPSGSPVAVPIPSACEGPQDGGPGSSPTPSPDVSIVLATLNERDNLPTLFERLFQLPLPRCEVIVVDSGSHDGTREFVVERAASDRRIRLLRGAQGQALVGAQVQGIRSAAGPLVVVMDGDLQHPPSVVPEIVAALRDSTALAIASRYAPGGSVGGRGMLRGLISRAAQLAAVSVIPEARQVSDPLSGFFGFHRDCFDASAADLRGYKLLLTLLVLCRDLGVAQIPYRFEERRAGSSKITRDPAFVPVFLSELFAVRRLARHSRDSYPVLHSPPEGRSRPRLGGGPRAAAGPVGRRGAGP